MSITVRDFDDIYLKAKAAFETALAESMQTIFEPVAMDAFAQQVRQLPAPVQADMKRRAPDAWKRIFGDDNHDSTI